MRRHVVLLLAPIAVPALLAAQAPSPVAEAFRRDAAGKEKNLIAAAETMPAADYGFKPTPEQMSFGDVVLHLAQGNDFLCGAIGGARAPARSKLDATADKAALVARLRETFTFCDQSLATLDDSRLSDSVPFFGGRNVTRAMAMTIATGDWSDHYSQSAIYLRLKGQLPPTAKR